MSYFNGSVKRRKLDSELATIIDDDDDDDIFTAEQIEELDLLATQAYGLPEPPSSSYPSSAEVTNDASRREVAVASQTSQTELEGQVESLKNEKYKLQGETKMLRQTLNKRDKEFADECQQKQRQYDAIINDYKSQIANLKLDLDKNRTELQFKEKEKNDVVGRLKYLEANEGNKSTKPPQRHNSNANVNSSDQFATTRFSFGISSNGQSEVKKVDEEKPRKPFILNKWKKEPDLEAELAIRLLRELNDASAATCQIDNIKTIVNGMIEALPKFTCDLQFAHFHRTCFGLEVMEAFNQIHAYFDSFMLKCAMDDVDVANATFCANILLQLVHFLCTAHKQSDSSSFMQLEANCNAVVTSAQRFKMNDKMPVINCFIQLIKVTAKLLHTGCPVKFCCTFLNAINNIKSLIDSSQLQKLNCHLLCDNLLDNLLQQQHNCNAQSTHLNCILCILSSICSHCEHNLKLCSQSGQCILSILVKSFNSNFWMQKSPVLWNSLLQLMEAIIMSPYWTDLLSQQCSCFVQMMNCIIVTMLHLTEELLTTQDISLVMLIKKGLMIVRHCSVQTDAFKQIRSQVDTEYVTLLSNLALFCKQRQYFSGNESLVVQDLWDFHQDDQDMFDNDDKNEISFDAHIS